MSGTVISYPIPAYANVPIESQFYQPSRFVISALVRGNFTTITTSTDHNYVIGQNIRLLIAASYGSYQLNEQEGYVISIPSSTQVIVDINSSNANAFIANPYTATITGAAQASHCVLTANNSFFTNNLITISGVQGMTQLNGTNRLILSNTPTTITLDIDSTSFNPYVSGGTVTLQSPIISYPQIVAIGDVNNGATNSSGSSSTTTYILGSFINIS